MECCAAYCRSGPAIDGARDLALGDGTKPRCARCRAWAVGACVFALAAALVFGAVVACAREFPSLLQPARPASVLGLPITEMDGEIPRDPGFAYYLGGFCYRAAYHSEATMLNGHPWAVIGQLNFTLLPGGERSWWRGPTGPGHDLYLFVYDDEPGHWPAIRDRWQTSTCEEKKAASSGWYSLRLGPWTTRSVPISEFSMARHWHAALVDCGSSATPWGRLRYRLTGVGALSRWGPMESNPDECPQDHWKNFKADIREFLTS